MNRQSRLRKLFVDLASIEIWVVGVVIALSLLSTRLLPVAVLTMAGFWLIRWLAFGTPSLRTPADWSIVVLLLLIPMTIWVSVLPEKTIPQIYLLLTGIAFYYALVNWIISLHRLKLIIFGTISVGFFLSIYALISVEWPISTLGSIQQDIINRFDFLVSDMANPNVMAGNLVILLIFTFSIILFAWSSFASQPYGIVLKVFTSIALVSMLAVVVFTYSRGAWLAFITATLILILLRWSWGFLGLPVVVLALSGLIYIYGIESSLDALIASEMLGGVDGRLEVLSRAIYMVQDFPFTGVGLGSFKYIADMMYPFFRFTPGTVEHAHNLFLQIAVDLGIPGLIAWLSISGIVGYIAWRVYKKGKKERYGIASGLGAGLLCSQIALVVHGLIDAVTWGMVRPAPIVWGIWGLAVAAGNLYLWFQDEHSLRSGLRSS